VIRILIVDDHAIVRHGLRQVIADVPGMRVAGEASSGQEALDLARTREFDVAIIDISMPGRGGLEVLKDLKAERPSLKLMVLSMHAEEQYAVRCLRDGASAYLTKGCATEDLVRAIRAVAAGHKYVTPSIAERLTERLDLAAGEPLHERLSDRELQVLVLLGRGRSPGDIARELSLSVKTVSTYRSRILEKMGMASTAELIRYAVQNGIGD
jgi:two-component system invasion response regulator UvrY